MTEALLLVAELSLVLVEGTSDVSEGVIDYQVLNDWEHGVHGSVGGPVDLNACTSK